MSKGMTRAERLRQMEWLYAQRAYTDIEIAEALGVDRATTWRDRGLLESEVDLYEESPGRYRIDRTHYISNIRLNLHEALAVYLATRRASRQTRVAQPHVARGLEKLAAALKQPMTERLARAAGAILDGSVQPERVEIVEKIAQAWAERRKVEIGYRGLRAQHSSEYLVSPYLIEPSLWSDGAYMIGPAERRNTVAAGRERFASGERPKTFKIERVERARLTVQSFTIPDEFDEEELLRYAWGIWYADGEPVRVRLRFGPGEAGRRVRESVWHPTQRIEETSDGGCVWTAQVAEWQEMLPWVRGWGADVEVLEPEELRRAVVQEVRRMVRRYLINSEPSVPRHWRLWAKATEDGMHRLIYHMIDVGQTAQALWRGALPDDLKAWLANRLGLPVEDTGRLLSFWAALHDLGKAGPVFQARLAHKQPQIPGDLRQDGFELKEWNEYERPARHEILTAYALTQEGLLERATTVDQSWQRPLAIALSGHHGAWQSWMAIEQLVPSECGGEEWRAARSALFDDLCRIFNPPECKVNLKSRERNAVLTIFSGFLVAADWLGSDENLFPFEEGPEMPQTYAARSASLAEAGLRQRGWVIDLNPPSDFDFAGLFNGMQPNPMQEAVIQTAGQIRPPALAIIEAPTGSGKTEAALSVYALWTQNRTRPGLYVAMPTTATSDQMHERVRGFLSSRHQMEISPLLVHSRARLREADIESGPNGQQNDESARRQAWFLPRKRSLLAGFGVGTVDQAFLSVLQTSHFFLRLFGLSHKIVIFDEVHAYDAYMSRIFCRLLNWLREIGASVILLSATLPESSRQAFIEAYTGNEGGSDGLKADYPRLTLAGEGLHQTYELPKPMEARALEIEFIPRSTPALTDRVRLEFKQGGCVAVICNTVRRAQEVFKMLLEANHDLRFCPDENLILFHARCPQEWRDEIQSQVLNSLSREARARGTRPERMLVVATQVIEQSLDLDFDGMITDMAPIDLVVQRAGRLQRHPPYERIQPYRLLIAAPELNGEIPVFQRYEYPYEPNFLLRTWVVLGGRHKLTLTGDAPSLVERVYREGPIEVQSAALTSAMKEMELECIKDRAAAEREAGGILVRDPSYATLLGSTNQGLWEDDDPRSNRALQAQTRRDAPGLSLVCVFKVNGKVYLDPKGEQPANLEHPNSAEVVRLARMAVSVRSMPVVNHFAATEPPAGWKRMAALRHHRLAVFENNQYMGEGFRLRLTPKLGMEIDYSKSGAYDDEL